MKNKINNITKMGMLQGLTALAAGSAVVRPASHPDAVFGLTWLLLQTVRELFFAFLCDISPATEKNPVEPIMSQHESYETKP